MAKKEILAFTFLLFPSSNHLMLGNDPIQLFELNLGISPDSSVGSIPIYPIYYQLYRFKI
jgi:hypothetical protein